VRLLPLIVRRRVSSSGGYGRVCSARHPHITKMAAATSLFKKGMAALQHTQHRRMLLPQQSPAGASVAFVGASLPQHSPHGPHHSPRHGDSLLPSHATQSQQNSSASSSKIHHPSALGSGAAFALGRQAPTKRRVRVRSIFPSSVHH